MAATQENAWASRLRGLREASGLTQAQLAESLGRSQPSIAGIETGRQGITLSQAHDWARACGGVLLVGTNDQAPLPHREAALVALLVERLATGLHPEHIRTLEIMLSSWPRLHKGSVEALSQELGELLRNRLGDVKS